jgi:hypothetical protein
MTPSTMHLGRHLGRLPFAALCGALLLPLLVAGAAPLAASDNLYAVIFDTLTDTEKLVIVDPATGSLTGVGTGIADCCFISSGVSSIDAAGDVFYFVGRFLADPSDDQRIYAFDLTTGALLSDPLLPTDTNYNFLEIDPSPGTLYGVVFDVLASQEKLVEVDPASGSLTPVGSGIVNCCGISSGVSALDPNGDVFYFIGALMTESDRRVFALDLATGAVLGNPLLPSTNNYNFLEFDANQPPVAVCQDVTVEAGPMCTADADVDDGSFDPEGGPVTATQDPPGPYGLGETMVTLTVEDDQGATDTCTATVTVVDVTAPVIECNAPPTITPPDAPISFTATAVDNCGPATVEVTGFDCFKTTKKGKRIDKTESCVVETVGATVTVLDSGGVGDHITWEVTATDAGGNEATETCEVEGVNPGQST